MNDPTDVLGRRIAAGLVDLLVILVLFVLVGLVYGEDETSGSSVGITLEGASALVFFALTLLYYGLGEAATGQTIGKRLLGVRVVRAEDGGKASGGQIALRTLLRMVDGILFYLVGLIAILATGSRRARLGDLAGRTAVVRA